MEEESSGALACFSVLPEGCTSEILSLTSPRDACRASAISWGFKSAAESDTVWERFLPSDYRQIISRSVSPVVYSTKKELYFRLCDSPILLDGGAMSFALDKKSGKKCYMLGADSRFSERAELRSVCWLDIRGKIETQMLSPKTTYAAYLVFKLSESSYGLLSAPAIIRFVNHERDSEAEKKARTVHLESLTCGSLHRQQNAKFPQKRLDGWMEIEMGEFYNDQGDDGEVEGRLIEIIRRHEKSVLIVEGEREREREIEREMEEESSGGVARLSILPEGCISDILLLTSPGDACRASAISWGFKSAAESDAVWERFLPSDYREIISRSVSPVVYSTKKELYFSLCNSPILLDGGIMSLSLEKGSGKKCYMLGARELSIVWGATLLYWKWTFHPDSRFSEVAKLLGLTYLDIRGRMDTLMLSPKTTYAAYLVFKLAKVLNDLESAMVSIRFVNHEREEEAENKASTIYLTQQGDDIDGGQQSDRLPRERMDGWMEIEMGEFYNDQGDDGVVEARLMETEIFHWKSGLIVQGIEFRPN